MKKFKRNYWVRCMKCGHVCKTLDEFDEAMKSGEWFISMDGWVWGYDHKCK